MKPNTITSKPQAYRLFVKDGKSMATIARETGISVRQLYRWAKKDKWREARENWNTSAMSISEKLLKMLKQDIEGMTTLDAKNVDRVIKAVKSIKLLDSEVDKLGSVIEIMDMLAKYLRSKDPAAFAIFSSHLPGFLEWVRYEFGEKRGIQR